jgi:hypothetical protein
MTKNWKKIGISKYSFLIDDNEIGTLDITLNSSDSKATARIHNEEFIIKRTGFWKTVIEINDSDNKLIAKVFPEKWYASSFTLDFNSSKYRLLIRNNPLAEYAIINENNEEILVYGLNTGNDNGMVNLKITNSKGNNHYLLDILLWYLFVPIATENMGENFAFTMLMTES